MRDENDTRGRESDESRTHGDVAAGASEEVTLTDGTRVVLRAIRPDDAPELLAAFRQLSPESRYRRFLSATATLSDEALRYLTDVDGVDHVAIVALHGTLDLKEERIVGVARFVRLPDDPEVAESAVTVVDAMQNRGLGKLLAARIRSAALARGVRKFRGEVLLSNAPMRHLLAEAGALVREETPGTMVFDIDLEEEVKAEDRTSMNKLLAAAASSVMVFVRRLMPPGMDGEEETEAKANA